MLEDFKLLTKVDDEAFITIFLNSRVMENCPKQKLQI